MLKPEIYIMSLWEPWASALAFGPKGLENRSWRRELPPGGIDLAVYACKGGFHRGVAAELRADLWPECPSDEDLFLSRGSIVGVIHVDRIDPVSQWRHDRWATGPWCWHRTGYWPLSEPVPIKSPPRTMRLAGPELSARLGELSGEWRPSDHIMRASRQALRPWPCRPFVQLPLVLETP